MDLPGGTARPSPLRSAARRPAGSGLVYTSAAYPPHSAPVVFLGALQACEFVHLQPSELTPSANTVSSANPLSNKELGARNTKRPDGPWATSPTASPPIAARNYGCEVRSRSRSRSRFRSRSSTAGNMNENESVNVEEG